MTDGQLCLHFCATYYHNICNWDLAYISYGGFVSIGVMVSKILANVF